MTSSASLGERITPVEALVELARSAREDPLDVVLNTVAATVHRVTGYRSGVFNLCRPAWDDYEMAVLVDRNDDVDDMQGQTNPRADFDRLPEMADERLPGVFLVSDAAFWEGISNVIFTPGWEASGDPEAWGQFDGLFVLLHDADGELLGNLSIDEPISGRRPTDADLRLLRAISSHAAYALGNARRGNRAAEMAIFNRPCWPPPRGSRHVPRRPSCCSAPARRSSRNSGSSGLSPTAVAGLP